MSSTITITTKVLGRRKRILDDWSIPFPPDLDDDGDSLTLRDLITRIVIEQIEAFRQRQERRKFIAVLTEQQIDAAAEKGKVDMGGRDLNQKVDTDEAVAAALQAFEDGLYLVSIDAQEYRDLDAQVFLQPDSRITFIRLVMLAGG
ncbi:MAG: hypothetical protein JXM70_15950 [Pirellulales bacterium]|nr:hypothetical protein [Pirellulales bacterium]